jgi:hypothetical protein
MTRSSTIRTTGRELSPSHILGAVTTCRGAPNLFG